jgi:hypothetical protein
MAAATSIAGGDNTSRQEVLMKKLSATLLGAAFAAGTVLATLLAAPSLVVTPAHALGGCGPNMHRGEGGRCYWGGQDEAWCFKHTGHHAVRLPNGKMICYRY